MVRRSGGSAINNTNRLIMNKRKPKTQSGFASFSMHELAELITKPIKPKQNDIQKDTRTKHIRNIRTDKV